MALNLNQDRKNRPTVTYWRSERVPNGSVMKCYAAGQSYWLNTHRVGVSKPCLKELTGGDLHCPWCGVIKQEYLGYVPFYTMADNERIVVTCHEDMKPRAQALRLHEPVTVSRGKRMTAAVRLGSEPWTTTPYQGPEDRMQPAAIFDWLVRLWGIADLSAYVQSQQSAAVAVVVQPMPMPTEDDLLSKTTGAIICAEETAKMKTILSRGRNRLKEVLPEERNGDHTPAKKSK